MYRLQIKLTKYTKNKLWTKLALFAILYRDERSTEDEIYKITHSPSYSVTFQFLGNSVVRCLVHGSQTVNIVLMHKLSMNFFFTHTDSSLNIKMLSTPSAPKWLSLQLHDQQYACCVSTYSLTCHDITAAITCREYLSMHVWYFHLDKQQRNYDYLRRGFHTNYFTISSLVNIFIQNFILDLY